MKIIDKFLKFLKTDRNTFFTYILTVLAIYFAVDRLIEVLLMIFTGVSVSYWGPIHYTIALACPVFAYLFVCSSSFIKNDSMKITFLYLYIITLYIIGVSMAIQWMNLICWLLFMSTPGYLSVVTELTYLIKPAFQSIAAYLPLVTFYPLMKWLILTVNDTNNIRKSIMEYSGINLTVPKDGIGAYSCEMPFQDDKKTGDKVRITENGRFQSTFICGISGSGKTSMLFEPMMAKDLEKKFFFKETSKELGYTALKSRIAILNKPYDNDYLNKNFNLNMISPTYGKEKVFKAFLSKMILDASTDNIIYKDVGLTSVSPDFESTSRMLEVAENFNIPVNLIDPNNASSIGLNPFTFEDPVRISLIISSVLKEMYSKAGADLEESYRQNASLQAVENVCILLKEMYPRLNGGDLPTLEDMLDMFNDFSLVENMCNKLMENEELAKKYKIQIGYFKKNFYANGINKADTEKYIQPAASQLDILLRVPGVKSILCNRSNNLNYDKALANGEITLVCTRRGDLGSAVHTAFGLFFLLLMQYSVLRRPGNEKSRIPHFLYIDEFPDFITHGTTNMFTLYRKYRVGIIISAQNLRQLGAKGGKYRDIILANCYNKFVFGNNTPEDNEWWSNEIGQKREWNFSYSYNTEEVKYDAKYGNAKLENKVKFTPGQVQGLGAKQCYFKIKDTKAKYSNGVIKVDYLASKYHEKHEGKQYNFNKFINGIATDVDDNDNKKPKFDLKNLKFDVADNGDVDPIKSNTTDSNFLFDNEDAIVFDINKKKDNN